MRVVLELFGIVSRQMGGTESYVRNLLAEFVKRGTPEDSRLWVGSERGGAFLGATATEYVADPFLPGWLSRVRYGRSLLQWLSVARDRRRWRPDVVHCTAMFPRPAWEGRGMVLSVLDLHSINQPGTFGRWRSAIMTAHCRLGVRRASRVITISEHVKTDLVRHFGCPPEKIDVTYLGADHDRYRPGTSRADEDEFRSRYRLPAGYLLYPASTYPHKNHGRLVEALALLRDRYSLSYPLVLTGARATAEGEILSAVAKHGLQDTVFRLDFLPEEDLVKCYQAAAAVVFPSLHEGFGLPIVEAMACGCPVACSSTTAAGEVAGGAAEIFDPTSTEAIAEAVRKVTTDSVRRDSLRRAGLARAAAFTWGRTAEQTLSAYRAAAGSPRE